MLLLPAAFGRSSTFGPDRDARARVVSWYSLVFVQFFFFSNQPELTLEIDETGIQAAAA